METSAFAIAYKLLDSQQLCPNKSALQIYVQIHAYQKNTYHGSDKMHEDMKWVLVLCEKKLKNMHVV